MSSHSNGVGVRFLQYDTIDLKQNITVSADT